MMRTPRGNFGLKSDSSMTPAKRDKRSFVKISNKLLSVIWNPVCSGADIFCKGVGGFDVQLFIEHRKRRDNLFHF